MRPARRLSRGIGSLLAAGLVVVSCTSPDDPDAPPEPEPVEQPEADDVSGPLTGGTLRVGLPVDPVSIDPRFVVDDEGELVVDALFDPLVRLDDAFEPVPAAAERWEVDDEARTFTFHLGSATFHDGTPVTSEDFRRSFDRIIDGTAEPPSFLGYLLEDVEGADAAQTDGEPLSGLETPDDETLVIRLTEPDPAFLATLSDPSLVPVPEVADEDPEAYAAAPIGNGPFAMAGAREPNAFIRLTRFEQHATPPLLDEVLLTVYPDDQDRDRQWQDLEAGQLQVAEVPAERMEEAASTYGASADGYEGPGLLDGITSTVYLYGFDTSRPPFDDPRLRRAISMAIDRDALADELMLGTRAAATSIVPPPFPGARPGACASCRHDPEAAAELFAQIQADPLVPDDGEGEQGPGEQDGATGAVGEAAAGTLTTTQEDEATAPIERLTLTHNRGVTHAAIAERMADDIEAALGIEVAFRAQDLQTLLQDVRSGEVPVFRLGWDSNEPHPGAYLFPLFHSSQVGRDNLTRYADDEVDGLLDDARADDDAQRRLATYATAERRVLADMPALPLLWYRHTTVVAPEVQDLVYSPLGRIDFASVWLDPDAA